MHTHRIRNININSLFIYCDCHLIVGYITDYSLSSARSSTKGIVAKKEVYEKVKITISFHNYYSMQLILNYAVDIKLR